MWDDAVKLVRGPVKLDPGLTRRLTASTEKMLERWFTLGPKPNVGIVKGAVEAALAYVRRDMEPVTTYGYFRGGDPRNFSPDQEATTEEQRSAWHAACETWDRADAEGRVLEDLPDAASVKVVPRRERPKYSSATVFVDGETQVVLGHDDTFGLGIYTYPVDAATKALLVKLEAALEELTC